MIILLVLALVFVGIMSWMVATHLLTLVEVMIIVVIIGLLAAMAIPVFYRVKETSIERALREGREVNKEDRKWYFSRVKDMGGKETSTQVAPSGSSLQTVILDGKPFYLLPKDEAEETRIAGKSYWLVPVNP